MRQRCRGNRPWQGELGRVVRERSSFQLYERHRRSRRADGVRDVYDA